MDGAYRQRTRTSLYTVEGHIAYLQEVPLGTNLNMATTLAAADAKRVHLFHEMFRESDGATLATYELLALHVDQAGPRVTAMPAPLLDKVTTLARVHAPLAAKLPREGSSRLAVSPRLPHHCRGVSFHGKNPRWHRHLARPHDRRRLRP